MVDGRKGVSPFTLADVIGNDVYLRAVPAAIHLPLPSDGHYPRGDGQPALLYSLSLVDQHVDTEPAAAGTDKTV